MRATLLAIVLLAAPLAHAVEDCEPTTTQPVLTVHAHGLGFPGYYVDVDNGACALTPTECGASVWIYEETNGIAGLQREDALANDTCGGTIEADTLIV